VEPNRLSHWALPMPVVAVRALERERVRQSEQGARVGSGWGSGWRETGLVFTSSVGGPLEPRNVGHRFDAIRAEAGLGWLRLHDLQARVRNVPVRAAVSSRGP
jgi:hypothetical protein